MTRDELNRELRMHSATFPAVLIVYATLVGNPRVLGDGNRLIQSEAEGPRTIITSEAPMVDMPCGACFFNRNRDRAFPSDHTEALHEPRRTDP